MVWRLGSPRWRHWQIPCLTKACCWFTDGLFLLCPHLAEGAKLSRSPFYKGRVQHINFGKTQTLDTATVMRQIFPVLGTHTDTHTLTIVHGAGKFFTALLVSLCFPSYVQSWSPRPLLPLVPNQKLIKFSSEGIYITQEFGEASGNKNYYMKINKSKENHIKVLNETAENKREREVKRSR